MKPIKLNCWIRHENYDTLLRYRKKIRKFWLAKFILKSLYCTIILLKYLMIHDIDCTQSIKYHGALLSTIVFVPNQLNCHQPNQFWFIYIDRKVNWMKLYPDELSWRNRIFRASHNIFLGIPSSMNFRSIVYEEFSDLIDSIVLSIIKNCQKRKSAWNFCVFAIHCYVRWRASITEHSITSITIVFSLAADLPRISEMLIKFSLMIDNHRFFL